MENEDVKNIKK